jgi:multidrug transporter EmrE-like cation transporter
MKKWWESKAVWAGLGLIGLALLHYSKSGDLTKAIELIFIALGIIGIRVGNTKIS